MLEILMRSAVRVVRRSAKRGAATVSTDALLDGSAEATRFRIRGVRAREAELRDARDAVVLAQGIVGSVGTPGVRVGGGIRWSTFVHGAGEIVFADNHVEVNRASRLRIRFNRIGVAIDYGAPEPVVASFVGSVVHATAPTIVQ